MATALITHAACLDHLTPDGHPERAERLRAVLFGLRGPDFADLQRIDAPLASEEQLLRAHPASYIELLKHAVPRAGHVALDPDTWLSPGSAEAAFRAAGAVVRGVEVVLSGAVSNAFCAVRPPGHHAEFATAMGFCLLGNAVIGARHALSLGLRRVAIADFDVHHGNGTQNLIWNDPNITLVTSHQMPLYPGSGVPEERGAHGQVLNLPLPPGSGGALFRSVWEERGLPFLEAARPELIIISAGFDAHRRDPLAGLMLDEGDFAWITGRLCDAADHHARGRIVSTLEGGYDLDALAASAAAHVRVLMERGA